MNPAKKVCPECGGTDWRRTNAWTRIHFDAFRTRSERVRAYLLCKKCGHKEEIAESECAVGGGNAR